MNNEFLIDSKVDLSKMFDMQEILNIKYNGKNWRHEVSSGKLKLAFLEECSEFTSELESDWKWYKNKDAKYNRQAALFELVDSIHFAMSLALYRHPLDYIKLRLNWASGYSPTMYSPVTDKHNQYVKAITRFLTACDRDNLEDMIIGILNMCQVGGQMFECSPGEIFQAYCIKNQRNHLRVEGGVMTGDYDKSKELELKLV